MSKLQIIYQGGKPAFAVVPWKQYEFFKKHVDEADLTDEELMTLADLEDDEVIPMYVSERLSAGEHPVKVFREYRNMTQKELAQKAGISPEYVSQIEGGKKQGSIDTLKAIAEALALDLDDLV
ncbi:MAG: helix-turn-helix domain-containing protein [Alphaproteobacteria bacterium]|nr:helix-turn-helix domain-containing protein [Alphaproteobacteria bacterium]